MNKFKTNTKIKYEFSPKEDSLNKVLESFRIFGIYIYTILDLENIRKK